VSVVVIGRGLAGCSAALALAERGVPVVQVAAAPGATALTGGTIDVAGASPGIAALPWRDVLRGEPLLPVGRLTLLRRTRPTHPYAAILADSADEADAEDRIHGATAALASWLAPAGLRVDGSLGENRVLANSQGTLRVADFVLTGPSEGDLCDAAEIAVVDVPGLEGYEARGLARSLAIELDALGIERHPIRVVRPRWPEGLIEPGAGVFRLAARLDRDDGLAAFAAATRRLGGEGRLLLFPPALGLTRTPRVLDAVRESTGCRVAEVLGFPPYAIAGYRLDRALALAVERSAVQRVRARATALRFEVGGTIRVMLRQGEPGAASDALVADAVILATGRFVGGGLVDEAESVREPLAGLPLFDEQGRRIDGIPAHRSVRKGYANPQPLYSAGVRVDTEMRALNAEGQPRATNLLAAGDLLGGFDPARERTGLGVALLSGLRAAEEAAAWAAASSERAR
jgi:glycerol-3-phosphate dehydrogenase subunit B